MLLAKVKYPYKKEWEKDSGYGVSAPITFENSEIGDYRQYVNAADPKKQWIRELKINDEVYLEKNSAGSGFIVKPVTGSPAEEDSQNNGYKQIRINAKVLGDCIKEVEAQLEDTRTPFTSEDIRSLSISLFIQSMRGKKADLEYSVN